MDTAEGTRKDTLASTESSWGRAAPHTDTVGDAVTMAVRRARGSSGSLRVINVSLPESDTTWSVSWNRKLNLKC